MILRAIADVIRFVVNMAIVVSVIGFLVAGGVVLKVWRSRP